MAKIEKTQTEVTLSSETKRYLRNLTSALEKVARGMAMYMPREPEEGPKRLSEPADDKPKENPYRSGGYVKPEPPLTEPAGYVDPKFGSRIELDAAAIQNLTQSIMNQKSYLQ